MLKTLTVWNFALLEHIQIDFGTGLNIITGETGAGKSILIDALGAILGYKVSAESIRTGCDWLRVEAVFQLENQPDLKAMLCEQAIDMEDDELIITRQVSANGRSSILVNGCHITLAVLKKIGSCLIDIHGQNENLALLKEANQYDLLDHSDDAILDAFLAYSTAYKEWSAKKQELEEKKLSAREHAQRMDMLRWQEKEIKDAELKEGEDEQLENDIRRLSHAEKIASYVEESYRLMDSSSKNGLGVLAALSEIKKNLESMSRFDDSLENSRKMLEDAYVSLQEVSYELRDYGESMEFQPQKLDELQKRMDAIYKLQKKYGASVKDILEYHKKICQELEEIENSDEDIAAMEKVVSALEAALRENASILTNMRKTGAKRLSAKIEEQLMELGMPKAHLSMEVEPLEKYTSNGADQLLVRFSANPGEVPKPLAKVVSGGELSRIALAFKTISAARQDAVPSMVFDEIDTGIGGRTAQMVAERIALVAKYKQVFCITHLPQIACMADAHLYIAKNSENNATYTRVKRLTDTERINEIARMASGADATAISLDNAREMILHADMKKQAFKNI